MTRTDVLEIEVANSQRAVAVRVRQLRAAIAAVLADAGVHRGAISVAIVADPTIRRLNHQYLGHDYATDVLSFVLARDGARLEGEIIASGETAAAVAPRYGWPPEHELLLYVVHGALHLVGYDDRSPAKRAAMRRQEAIYLAGRGIELGAAAVRRDAGRPAARRRAARGEPAP
jgi:probable rRNA maturation factor